MTSSPGNRYSHGMVILILIDGLTYPVFERLLGEGRLPNIQRVLLERLPGVAGPALTTFPSTTAPLPEAVVGVGVIPSSGTTVVLTGSSPSLITSIVTSASGDNSEVNK